MRQPRQITRKSQLLLHWKRHARSGRIAGQYRPSTAAPKATPSGHSELTLVRAICTVSSANPRKKRQNHFIVKILFDQPFVLLG
jgi:hypothetical protein